MRKANGFSDAFPVFTVQGGMKRDQLRGINKSMIDMLIKMMSKKVDKTEEECAMLEMIQAGGDFWNAQNLDAVIAWYQA